MSNKSLLLVSWSFRRQSFRESVIEYAMFVQCTDTEQRTVYRERMKILTSDSFVQCAPSGTH